jgi:ferredoxin
MKAEKSKTFLDNWIIQHVHTTVPAEDREGAMQLALKCLQDAEQQGITRHEVEAAAGEDLVKCLVDAQKAVPANAIMVEI